MVSIDGCKSNCQGSFAGGRLVSIFDGVTEYSLGTWTIAKCGAKGWPPLDSCLYACASIKQAVGANFPEGDDYHQSNITVDPIDED